MHRGAERLREVHVAQSNGPRPSRAGGRGPARWPPCSQDAHARGSDAHGAAAAGAGRARGPARARARRAGPLPASDVPAPVVARGCPRGGCRDGGRERRGVRGSSRCRALGRATTALLDRDDARAGDADPAAGRADDLPRPEGPGRGDGAPRPRGPRGGAHAGRRAARAERRRRLRRPDGDDGGRSDPRERLARGGVHRGQPLLRLRPRRARAGRSRKRASGLRAAPAWDDARDGCGE